MDDDEAPRRSSRRLARNRFRVPSNAHYVGYVEDNETPEMIMKKFEELDKVLTDARPKAATESTAVKDSSEDNPEKTPEDGAEPSAQELKGASGGEEDGGDGLLNDEQLAEVFNRTSMFTVKSAMARDEALLRQEFGEDVADVFCSDEEFFLSEDDEGFYDDDGADVTVATNKGKIRGRKQEGRARAQSYQLLPDSGAGTMLRIRKKTGMSNQGVIKLQVPKLLPLSWGRTIKPLGIPKRLVDSADASDPDEAAATQCHHHEDLTSANLSAHYRKFIGVLINSGWELPGDTKRKVSRLAKIPMLRLNPHGFIFIWLKKEYIQAVWSLMASLKYTYVENLTWVILQANNQVVLDDSDLARVSHLTLYIFRKDGEGKDIEIRHQRSSDVILDTVQAGKSVDWKVPEQVYQSLETMLPQGKGKFLELWSDSESARPGWVHMCEIGERTSESG
ncbi:hypothetical protein BSKO_03610 [Bryopsis sp. KO-2023]|nr:hypothetical protein BSKO_03610 [Bryopsis sp. KO-2023]